MRSVVGARVVRGAAGADESLPEAGGAIAHAPLVVVGVDANVEKINICVHALMDPHVLAVELVVA